jgi:hypothetical protein
MNTKYLFLFLFAGIIAAGIIISLALMEETALPANGGEIKKFSSVDEPTCTPMMKTILSVWAGRLMKTSGGHHSYRA